jgi:hypothetical protein
MRQFLGAGPLTHVLAIEYRDRGKEIEKRHERRGEEWIVGSI